MSRIDLLHPHVFHVGDNRHEPVRLNAPTFHYDMRDENARKAEARLPSVRQERMMMITAIPKRVQEGLARRFRRGE